MNKKILIGSIIAAVIVALLPISSVVGVQQHKINEETTTSPLFAVRMHQQLKTPTNHKPTSQFIGKGMMPTIFVSRRSTFNTVLERAYRIIDAQPQMFEAAIQRIISTPQAQEILEEYDLDKETFDQELQAILNDPDVFQEALQDASELIPFSPDDPIPLGLSTSSAIGCFIVALVMIPLLVTIGLLIATLTIITCINLGGCFENLMNALVEGFIQGLTPPDDLV